MSRINTVWCVPCHYAREWCQETKRPGYTPRTRCYQLHTAPGSPTTTVQSLPRQTSSLPSVDSLPVWHGHNVTRLSRLLQRAPVMRAARSMTTTRTDATHSTRNFSETTADVVVRSRPPGSRLQTLHTSHQHCRLSIYASYLTDSMTISWSYLAHRVSLFCFLSC